MSGRVHVTLADGRYVRGFRKTLRINKRAARTPLDQLPDWRLSFPLPTNDMRFLTFAEGQVLGVTIERACNILQCVVTAKTKEYAIRKVVEFVRSVAPDYRAPINAKLEQGTILHPCQIKLGQPTSTITFSTHMRSLTY